MLLSALNNSLEAILSALRPRVLAEIRGVEAETAAEAAQKVTEPIWQAVQSARVQAFLRGAQFAAEQAREFGYRAPDLPTPGYAPQAVQTVVRENWHGPDSPDLIADELERHVRTASRQAVMTTVDEINLDEDNRSPSDDSEEDLDTAWADLDAELAQPDEGDDETVAPLVRPELGWARVLGANENHCAFCVMLAARGPVYSTAAAAGRQKASEKFGADAKGWVNRFHRRCKCRVVMVPKRGKWAGWDQVRELESFYDRAIKRLKDRGVSPASGPNYASNVVLQEIDAMLRELEEEGDELRIPSYAA